MDDCIGIKDFDSEMNKIEFYAFLHSDIVQMIKHLADQANTIVQLAPTEVEKHSTILRQNFTESCNLLDGKRANITNRIVQEILGKSVGSIKQVNDIPRLYRKTNREIPSKPCGYVDQMLEPSKRFSQQYSNDIGMVVCQQICRDLFSALNVQ